MQPSPLDDISYLLKAARIEQLNELAAKYTHFTTFQDLVSTQNNYNPVIYFDASMPHFAKRDIKELATAFDDLMKKSNDPRRIYNATE